MVIFFASHVIMQISLTIIIWLDFCVSSSKFFFVYIVGTIQQRPRRQRVDDRKVKL